MKCLKQQICPRLAMSAILLLLVATMILIDVDIPVFSPAEKKIKDAQFRIRGPLAPSGNVVIVAVDDNSLALIGRWPWPRYVMAQLISMVAENGATTIGIDLLFTEPEPNPEKEQIHRLISDYIENGLMESCENGSKFFDLLVESAESADNDRMLASAIRNADSVVLAMALNTFGQTSNPEVLTQKALWNYPKLKHPALEQLPSYSGCLAPIAPLATAASALGFVNISPDKDGVSRTALVSARYKNKWFLSLPVETIRQYLNISREKNQLVPGKLQLSDSRYIPIDNTGRMRINYYGPSGTIPRYSAVDILSGQVDVSVFSGKCVFFGAMATGLGDHWPNPYSEIMYGVEIQSVIADNILTGRYLRRPGWLKYIEVGIVLLFGIATTMATWRFSIWNAFLFMGLVCVTYSVCNQLAFVRLQIYLAWIYPIVTVITIGMTNLTFRYLRETKEKRELKSAFRKYMSPALVEEVMRHPEKLCLGGDEKVLTVIFIDIRGFTKMAEKLNPTQLVTFINEYLTFMTDILLKNGGILDKYIGDAIMGVFGVFKPDDPDPKQAIDACQAAVLMMQTLHEKRLTWGEPEKKQIQVGIGINTGKMVIGNMGSQQRFDYTVMGDAVNLASRLEGMSKLYGVKIVVSEFTKESAGTNFTFRELDIVRVKGKAKPVRIFELLGEDYFTNGTYAFVETFESGLNAYRRQQWDDAEAWFRKTLELKPGDKPSLFYLNRCEQMRRSILPENWDGVFVAQSK